MPVLVWQNHMQTLTDDVPGLLDHKDQCVLLHLTLRSMLTHAERPHAQVFSTSPPAEESVCRVTSSAKPACTGASLGGAEGQVEGGGRGAGAYTSDESSKVPSAWSSWLSASPS